MQKKIVKKQIRIALYFKINCKIANLKRTIILFKFYFIENIFFLQVNIGLQNYIS